MSLRLSAGALMLALIAGATQAALAAGPEDSAAVPAIPSSPMAPPWSANVKVNDDTGTTNQVEVDLAVAPGGKNLVAGWVDYRTGTKCAYSASQDGGVTWGKNFLVASTGGGITGDSTLSADDVGNLYLICMDYGAKDLKFAVSYDGGITFSSWRSITAADDKPWLRGVKNGTLYLTYTSGSNQLYRLSKDNGATWSSTTTLGSGNQGTAIAPGSGGLVHIGFNGQGNSLSYVRSKDYGATLEPRKSIVADMGQFCFSCTPRNYGITGGGSDPTGKYVAYAWAADRGSGNDDVWVVYSKDSGDTWTAPIKANDDGGSSRQFQPWVDVDSSGNVHVIWTDLRNGGQNAAYYANMSASSSSFGPNVEATDGRGTPPSFMGDYKSVQVVGDTAYGAWCDSRSGNGDIYFSRAKVAAGPAQIAKIEVTPSSGSITADQTRQFGAKAFDASNNQVNATFAWSSTGGSVDQAGLFTPSKTGTFDVTASAGGKNGTASITVTHGAMQRVVVSPPSPTITADQTLRFTAEGEDAKANRWPLSPVSWSVPGGPDAGSVDSSGLFTPNMAGTHPVEAADGGSGMKGSAIVTVQPGAVAQIEISPNDVTISADDTQQYGATGSDGKGNPVQATFAWTATSGSISAAGIFTPDRAGKWSVSAAAQGKSGSVPVTVVPGVAVRLEIEPAASTIPADETLKLAAVGYDKNGNAGATIGTMQWSVGSGQVAPDGTYSPEKAGAWTVTLEAGAATATASVTVTPGKLAKLAADPSVIVLDKGRSRKIALKAEDAKGNGIEQFTRKWEVRGDPVGRVGDPDDTFISTEAGESTLVATASANGGEAIAEVKVSVRGGLLDAKGGGQLPLILVLLLAALAAGVAALLYRRKKRRVAAMPPQQTYAYPQAYPVAPSYGAPRRPAEDPVGPPPPQG